MKAAFSGCGAPVAMVWAKHQPDAGVALNPPQHQPPLRKSPSIGVVPMIGEPSIDVSMIPPHWRRTRRREKDGTSATAHAVTASTTGRFPRCASLV